MSNAGHSIRLRSDASYAEHAPYGHTSRIYERAGVCVMPVWGEHCLGHGQALL